MPSPLSIQRERDERRRFALKAILTRLSEETGRPPAGAIERAVDLVHALTSFDVYDRLAGDQSRPTEVLPLVQRLVETTLDAIVAMPNELGAASVRPPVDEAALKRGCPGVE